MLDWNDLALSAASLVTLRKNRPSLNKGANTVQDDSKVAYTMVMADEEGYMTKLSRKPVPVGTTLGDYIFKAFVKKQTAESKQDFQHQNSFRGLTESPDLCTGLGSAPPADESVSDTAALLLPRQGRFGHV